MHPNVSLTDFVDFVAKSGRPKQTHVNQIKCRNPYEPREDFWRTLRNAIIDYHRTGQTDRSQLEDVLLGVFHKPKLSNYPQVIDEYKRFLGRKTISWFPPNREDWTSGGLTVRVNPELGLVMNGERHLLKLYFKGDQMTKAKADLILLLMKDALPELQPDTKLALLDVRRNKLFADASPNSDLRQLLHGEAISFATIWSALPNPSPTHRSAVAA